MVDNTTSGDESNDEQPTLDAVYSVDDEIEQLRLEDDDGNVINIIRGKTLRMSVSSSDYDVEVFDKESDSQ